ncbi:hypothetical protein ACH5RR_015874 [Cinchona calisaya]|uniref:SWIM-type domain-containing protein n=1 Tax=Cinchona calisaya TaxID=153742 RepID=A0ABD2ZUB0_9GENT
MHIFEVHYGGEFVHIPEFKYVGGKVAHFEEVDPDLMSYFEVLDCLREISVPTEIPIYYIVPNADLEHGRKLLISDQNVLEMFEMNMGHQIIHIYSGKDANGNNNGENLNGNNDGENLNGNNDGEDANGNNNGEHGNGNNDGLNENYQDEESELEVDSDFEYFLDGDTLSDGCDPLDEKETVKKAKEQWGRPPDYVEYEQLIGEDFEAYIAEKGKGKIQEEEVVSDDEVLNQALNSSNDEVVDDFPEFNAERELEKPDLVVGQLFNNVAEFRVALKQHAIVNGLSSSVPKMIMIGSLPHVKNCGWRIHASKFRGSLTFQIKTLDGIPHRCPWSYKNKSANSRGLAQKFIRQIANDPSIRVRNFKQTVKDKLNINVSDNQLYRAKSKAIRTIQGEHKEQYWRLRDYCATILERNPGSCALVVTETYPMYENHIFKRMFVMFNAQKEGFISACRPVIGLDAFHLKCTMGGQLMAAIARDANNQMFPLAMALVESEYKDSWGRFVETLTNHIGRPQERGWIFISDRQKALKGLIDSIEELFPGVEHRYCVRHMYANFKLRFKEKHLIDIMWAAARAYVPDKLEEFMRQMQAISPEVYAWLSKIPRHLWVRHPFSPRAKCDLLSNNICECFNQWIKEARNEPVLSMFEMIRRQVMCRFHEKRLWISKVKSRICPRIIEKLEDYKFKVPFFDCLEAGRGVWEVIELRKTYVVALNENSCSCNEWNLNGIPCVHATTTIVNGNNEPSEFVNDSYTVDSYKITYQHMIMPIPDDSLWVDSKSKPIGAENLNSQEEAISSNTTFQNPSSITANQPPSRAFEIGSSSRGRDRGKAQGRAWGRGAKFGPYCGIGNWNGLGMSNMKSFIPHSQVIPPNNVQEHHSPTKMWTTNSSTAHNSTLTSNVNPVGKGVGREELRVTSVSSIGLVGSRVSAGMSRGRGEVLKIQARFGVQLLASQSSTNFAKKSAA